MAKYATFFPTVAQVIDIVANVEEMVRERVSQEEAIEGGGGILFLSLLGREVFGVNSNYLKL